LLAARSPVYGAGFVQDPLEVVQNEAPQFMGPNVFILTFKQMEGQILVIAPLITDRLLAE